MIAKIKGMHTVFISIKNISRILMCICIPTRYFIRKGIVIGHISVNVIVNMSVKEVFHFAISVKAGADIAVGMRVSMSMPIANSG